MQTKNSEDRRRVLRAVPLFAACTDKELAYVDAVVDDIDVEPGEVLVREDQPGGESFVIVTGTAGVTLRGQHLTTLTAGEVFGEMALLEHKPRSATVVALSPMHLLVITPVGMARLLDQPGVARIALRSVVARLRAQEERTEAVTHDHTAGANR